MSLGVVVCFGCSFHFVKAIVDASDDESEADLGGSVIVPSPNSTSTATPAASSPAPGTPTSVVSMATSVSIGTSVSQRGEGQEGRKKKRSKEVHQDSFINRIANNVGKQKTLAKKKRKVPVALAAIEAVEPQPMEGVDGEPQEGTLFG